MICAFSVLSMPAAFAHTHLANSEGEAHMDDRPARRKFVFFKKFMSSFDFQPHIRVLVNALSLVRAVLSSICDRKL